MNIRLNHTLLPIAAACALAACTAAGHADTPCPLRPAADFVRVSGHDLIRPDGSKLFIMGTNLGNWLNPEGYMFGFEKTNSAHQIDLMLRQMVGPDAADSFWSRFKDSYVTRDDIRFIARQGANTVRLPFNYRLFADDDYMGLRSAQDGFSRIDSLVEWCRESNLYLILDMHDAPGGQTGDNIDDSYGYPWLMESEPSQRLFCSIWRSIALRYRNEPVILGYELMNEPIAPYFDNMEQLNARLPDICRMAIGAIREVDTCHIVLVGGAQWNSNFRPFTQPRFDSRMVYTCHRYGGEPTAEAIEHFISFRDSVGLPMYMGEIGHNTELWQADFCRVLKDNNIGYTFWPYKKVDNQCFAAIERPAGWQMVVDFAEADRQTYAQIRAARPCQAAARRALDDFVEACRLANCRPQTGYISSLAMTPAADTTTQTTTQNSTQP